MRTENFADSVCIILCSGTAPACEYKMKYVYPKLSRFDLCLFRIGGAGLGNLLFVYGRALAFAKKNGYEMIWPTWPSLKIGPWIRHELDKRTYVGMFRNRTHYISGLKKAWLLVIKRKVDESNIYCNESESEIVVFKKFIGNFDSIRDDFDLICSDLITNMRDQSVLNFDFSDSVVIHVRLGDFSKATTQQLKEGKHDCRLPIEWYCNMLRQVREAAQRSIKAYIFSDGSDEELKILLDMPNTERITFGNAINDIIALSRAPMMIASGSSFSMWARYLGRHSVICYINQIKEKILTKKESAFEIEVEDRLTEDDRRKIHELYAKA